MAANLGSHMSILRRFSTRDLITIAIMAAIGIAIKPLISPLSKLISTPLMLPGGSFAGGFYMMWMVLAVALTGKPGAATLFGVIQAVVVLINGSFGNHGALSLLTYTLPGLVLDLVAFAFRDKKKLFSHLSLCAIANLTGSLTMSVIIFRNPIPMLIATGCLALASGIVGGYLSWLIHHELRRLDLSA